MRSRSILLVRRWWYARRRVLVWTQSRLPVNPRSTVLIVDAHPEVHSHPPLPTESVPPVLPTQRHRSASTRDHLPPRRISNTEPRLRSNSASTPPKDVLLSQLHRDLDRLTHDTGLLAHQIDEEEQSHAAELARAQSELDHLRGKRKEEDDHRAKTRQETRALEDRKRAVDAQLRGKERTIRSLGCDLANVEAEQSSRLRTLAEREQALHDLCEETSALDGRVRGVQSEGERELKEGQRMCVALEESNRILAHRLAIRKGEAGDVSEEEERGREKWILQRENEEDERIEREWVASQRILNSKIEGLNLQLEEVTPPETRLTQTNREFREALNMLIKARELHSPPGLTPHPVPLSTPGKSRTKKPRSRKSRQRALSSLGATSSSPNLSANESISRPTSSVLPTNIDLSKYYDAHQYLTPSPWASTQSLTLIHDPTLTLDTHLDRERLTAGAPLSPSVSEHLLPSNLFGPEEDIHTSPFIDRLISSSHSLGRPLPPLLRISYPPATTTTADSPISEISTRSSFSSPNQSHPYLPLPPSPHFPSDRSALLRRFSIEDEPVEISSPAELNGIPLTIEDCQDTLQKEISSSKWRIPSLSFKRKPPEKRLPPLGSLKAEKSQSMPRTLAGVTPIGHNRPRSGSGGSWYARSRAPSETGRQFDATFDPLESRQILESAGIVHARKPSKVKFPADRVSRRSNEVFSPGYFRQESEYPEILNPWSVPSTPLQAAFEGMTSSPVSIESLGVRSSLDPEAPEFRMDLDLDDTTDLSRKKSGRFTLGKFSSGKTPGDSSFLNNFTGFFRRESSKPGEDPKSGEDDDTPPPGVDLSRPKSQDTLISGDGTEELVEPVSAETARKKTPRKKGKGMSLFRWDSKLDVPDEVEVSGPEAKEEEEETPKRGKRKKRKGVKFEEEEVQGGHYFQGREVSLDSKFLLGET
jgi:hypothetical protein